MGAAVKLVLGLVVLIVGLFLWVDSVWLHFTQVAWWQSFVSIIFGIVPFLLVLVGIFVVWLEIDELKANKELKSK